VLLRPVKEKPWFSWLLVALWAAAIFFSIPLARRMQQLVADTVGRNVFGYTVIVAVVLGCLYGLTYLYHRRRDVKLRQFLWVAGVGATYLAYTARLWANPEEALHFIEYGALSLLIFRALTHRFLDPLIYVLAALICSMVGTVDEFVQWIVPQRYFDFRDIRLNAISGALIQLGLALGLQPKFVAAPVRYRSLRAVCVLGSGQLLLLGLCLSNTPERVESYAARIPQLGFLSRNPSTMNEFGYRHVLPGAGYFFSRLTVEEILAQDARRADEAADILDRYGHPKRYDDFLETYTPGVDPFLHELRVRLFRRDRYLAAASDSDLTEEQRVRTLEVAGRENRILETYYSRTVSRTRYPSLDSVRMQTEWAIRPGTPYTSPVSASIIWRFSEGAAWGFILVAVALLLALAVTCTLRMKPALTE